MANFTFNRKGGYEPVEVDKYISNLEQQIHSYEDKSAAIQKAIISAQCAADNMIKASTDDAKKVLDSAKAEAEKIVSDAKNEIANSSSEAEKIIADAKAEAERISAESKDTHTKALEEAKKIIAQAEAEKAEILKSAKIEKNKMLKEANQLAAHLHENADVQFESIKNNITQQKDLINSFSSDYVAFCEKIFNSDLINEYQALRDKYAGSVQKDGIQKINADLDKITDLAEELMKTGSLEEKLELEEIEEDTVSTVTKTDEIKTEEPAVEAIKPETADTAKVEAEKTETDEVKIEETKEPAQISNIKAEEPKIKEPEADAVKVEEPKVEKPEIEVVKAEEPKIEKPKADAVKVEEPKVEEPAPAVKKPGIYRVKPNSNDEFEIFEASFNAAKKTQQETANVEKIAATTEQPASKPNDVLSRVMAGYSSTAQQDIKQANPVPSFKAPDNKSDAPKTEGTNSDILSRVKSGLKSDMKEVAIKTGLGNAAETAGIPAPKSYLAPEKKLGPSPFVLTDDGQPRKPGVYRVPSNTSNNN